MQPRGTRAVVYGDREGDSPAFQEPLSTKFSMLRAHSCQSETHKALKVHEKDGVMVSNTRVDQASSEEAELPSGLLLASVLVGFPK